MKPRTRNLCLGLVYAALLIWGLVTCVQTLAPLGAQLADDRALLAVTINPDLQTTLTQAIATNTHQFSAWLLLYLGSLLFLTYLVSARALNCFAKKPPRCLLPLMAGLNLLLILAAGLVCPAACTPNFFTIAVPAVFMGVLPLLTGVKIVVKK